MHDGEVWISRIGHALPGPALDQERLGEWIAQRAAPGSDLARLRRFSSQAGVATRHSVLDLFGAEGERLYPRLGESAGTAARNALFGLRAPELAQAAVAAACPDGIGRITHVIGVTCTGALAPGLEAILVERLGLPADTRRAGINFQGCYAGITGLRTAAEICRGEAGARVLVVCCELSSLHFQAGPAPDTLLAACLFADGAAAAVVESAPEPVGLGLRVTSFASLLIPQTGDRMAWSLGDHGFSLSLSPVIARCLAQDLGGLVARLLPTGLEPGSLRWWVHPGGPRILDAVIAALRLSGDALDGSRDALAVAGNRSSGTVLAIAEVALREAWQGPCGMLAFGPGLTCEALFLERAS